MEFIGFLCIWERATYVTRLASTKIHIIKCIGNVLEIKNKQRSKKLI